MKNKSWSEAVVRIERSAEPYALVTVLATAGSTPRGSGSKMVVTAEDTYASIGGGQLEFLAVQQARTLMQSGSNLQEIKNYTLGAKAGQCCGGSVTVLTEVFAEVKQQVIVFGAGHISAALVSLFKELPFQVTIIDTRKDFLEDLAFSNRSKAIHSAKPWEEITHLPEGASVLVLTHDHGLDYQIVSTLIENWRWRFVGLIGSDTKAKRFRARLKREGFDQEDIDRIQCPMGIPDIKGKLPMEVAVSVTAKLLSLNDSLGSSVGMDWREMKRSIREISATEAGNTGVGNGG
tara:strand:- start:27 stop:899 length:873 start_codon:yes stop_codon:yes gene_type:complete